MIVNNIVKKSVTLAVKKGIRDIKDDPHRSIRNQVDLAMHLSTGRFRMEFLRNAQNMLSNSQSPYYTLAGNIVNQFSAHNLEKFGVNLGYMSWTYGARFIREYENEHGVNVPWTLIIDLDYPAKKIIDLKNIISQGKKLGIYTYTIFIGNDSTACNKLLNAINTHDDCAFIIIGNYEGLQRLNLDGRNCANTAIFPDYNDDNFDEMVNELHRLKHIAGVLYEYNDANAEDILNGTIIEELQHNDQTALLLMETPDCSETTRSNVVSFVDKCRREQRYPMFILDFFSDITYIDHIISDETCIMGIRADGAVTTAQKVFNDVNAIDTPLEDIINMLMPKVQNNNGLRR